MLVSGSVSPNVLPGIVKAVEKYILIYNTDEVLKTAGATAAGRIMSTGGALVGSVVGGAAGAAGSKVGGAIGGAVGGAMTSSIDNSLNAGSPLSEAGSKSKPGSGGTQRPVNVTFKTSSGGGGAKPSLDIPRGDSISLEPTWLQVTTKKKGVQILGVKVVPFRIKSSDSILSLISQDKQLKFLSYLTTKYGRGIVRVFYRLMKKLRIPILKDRPITGDPRKDVLFAQSIYGKNMFIAMSQMDMENEDIFSQPGGLQKLQKLGWASFIVVDDVNRRTTFCMKEFQGVCSIVPFNYMFTSYGKDFNQAYEDLEDIKKASGPFFNMKTNRKRAFSESKTSVDKYLDLIQGK